jgi:hypothetical protein
MVVKTKPYGYNAEFLRTESPGKYSICGTVYAENQEDAIEKVEILHTKQSRGVLRAVTVHPRWGEEAATTSQHLNVNKHVALKPIAPKFDLAKVDGMDYYYNHDELNVTPWPCTYKADEGDNDE